MTDPLRLLRELIALPSVNPAFLPPDDPHAGEQRVAEFVAAVAASHQLDVELQEIAPRRPNVLARLSPAQPPKHRVLLAPHTDTVGGDLARIFHPVVRQGRLHGRGACDTKGSLAVMLTALNRLAASRSRPRQTEIVLAALVDEENAQLGSRALARTGPKGDLALVGEPTNLRIVTAHKGNVWIQLETAGRAAHGSRPDLGRNAILEMARIVQTLETDYAASLRRRRHPLLGHGTVNVGTILGGRQPNIVPDTCAIGIDRRILPGETDASVRREIAALLRRRGLRARFTNLRDAACPALETDPHQPLLQQLLRAAAQRRPQGVHYFCDAAVLAAAGTPSVVFGPGDIAQAHTADEWVRVSQLEQGVRLLSRFFESLP